MTVLTAKLLHRFRLRSCSGKVRYTWGEASSVAAQYGTVPYRCAWCGWSHAGHRPFWLVLREAHERAVGVRG